MAPPKVHAPPFRSRVPNGEPAHARLPAGSSSQPRPRPLPRPLHLLHRRSPLRPHVARRGAAAPIAAVPEMAAHQIARESAAAPTAPIAAVPVAVPVAVPEKTSLQIASESAATPIAPLPVTIPEMAALQIAPGVVAAVPIAAVPEVVWPSPRSRRAVSLPRPPPQLVARPDAAAPIGAAPEAACNAHPPDRGAAVTGGLRLGCDWAVKRRMR